MAPRNELNMQLSKLTLPEISSRPGLTKPEEQLLALPEKVLQFGTGVLLRGLPDYFIDKANRQGIFNGRVVVVKSTSTGGADAFDKQNGLYTLCIRGVEDGNKVDEVIINSSISRVLSAKENWSSILECAYNADMQIIISNTTEVGITLTEDDVRLSPPHSFPGKLLAFLYERYKAFGGTPESGMVIVPTELIPDNGNKLRSIVLELAARNKLDNKFISWVEIANDFCNSLVDRIVPGKLAGNDRINTEKKLGYTDELMILSECFRLWAIESGSERVKEILSFTQVDEGAVIAPDIEKFRELKLRLLNGTHTFSCGLAYLAGFTTVREAMSNEFMFSFVHNLAIQEIATALSNDTITYAEACDFATKVMDRFRNPSLDHQWISISVQYSSKMKMRNVPILLRHYSKTDQVPEHMALGFAAYLLFMKLAKNQKDQYAGQSNGTEYVVQDDHAEYLAGKWNDNDAESVVDSVLSDKQFWGTDLTRLNGFAEAVKTNVRSLMRNGVMPTLRRVQLNKTV
jgi:tagaturonate reductase